MTITVTKSPFPRLRFNFGTFGGFNYYKLCNLGGLTAQEVVDWDHDIQGEADFCAAGDHPGVSFLFPDSIDVAASELVALDRLLGQLGGDTDENFIRIKYCLNLSGTSIADLRIERVLSEVPAGFLGKSLAEVERHRPLALRKYYCLLLNQGGEEPSASALPRHLWTVIRERFQETALQKPQRRKTKGE